MRPYAEYHWGEGVLSRPLLFVEGRSRRFIDLTVLRPSVSALAWSVLEPPYAIENALMFHYLQLGKPLAEREW
jgi:hypothetical protein